VDPVYLGERCDIKPVEEPHHDQRREALPIRGTLGQGAAAIFGRERRCLLGTIGRKVFKAVCSAFSLQGGHHVGGDLTLVEGLRALAGNPAQSTSQRGIGQAVPGDGRASAGKVLRCRRGMAPEPVGTGGPVARDTWRDDEPPPGGFNGWGQAAVQTKAPILLAEPLPPANSARYGHGLGGQVRDLVQPPLTQPLERGTGRGTA
jgi:hypothetical protein